MCGLPAKTSSATDYKYAVEEDGYLFNTSSKFSEPHYVNGYCFSKLSYYEHDKRTVLLCTVTNVSDVTRGETLPEIYIYDDTGMVIIHFGGIIGNTKPGDSVLLNAGVTTTGIVDAYDYAISFSPEDTLNSDKEIAIKKGIICTSHEVKENDSVTLICEESDEGVEYQLFWSINKSGGGNMIQGANDRRLILSNVSLEQSGRYYYCQINKKGKIEYTDRFELVVTSMATSKPALSPTPRPFPTAVASPTPKVSAEPTVRPTIEPTETPTTNPTEGSISKNKRDVNALNAIIAEQKALGATISEDLDSDEYVWTKDGRLIAVKWAEKNLQGSLSFQELSQLLVLVCDNNQLTDLDVSSNTALTVLWCTSNQLTALDIGSNRVLAELICNDNQLAALDVSKNMELKVLGCNDNQLTSLNISNNMVLETLECSGNQLTSLDISGRITLIELLCNDNQLTGLDVSNDISLKRLDCTDNSLTSLDISSNTALTSLYCSDNHLTGLDVSNNTALAELRCFNNYLTSLDVSKNTVLAKLYCEGNQLTGLDVSNNTALTNLGCYANQLTSLDVSNCTALINLNCDKDVIVTGRPDLIVPASSPEPIESPAVLQVKNFGVQQTTSLKAKLTWEKVTLDNMTLDRITVLRAEKKSGPYFIVKQFFGSSCTSCIDENVERGKTYYYKVAAHSDDSQAQLFQTDLTVKKITIGYLIPPVITIKKGTSGGQKYVQIFLKKYEGQYADIYMKSSGRFQKLAMKKRTIRSYRKRYRFRYRKGDVTLYFRVRTYRIVKGRKRISPYSKIVKIKI